MYHNLESYDPNPIQYKGTIKEHLPSLLEKVRGKSISLLFDEAVRTVWQQTHQLILHYH